MSTQQTTLTPPRIGEYWPGQGGVLCALMRGANGSPDYYLIACADKQHIGLDLKWSTDKTEVPDLSDLDGEANTRILHARKGKHPAAMHATKCEADGWQDFYLPSRREARAIWANTPELLPSEWIWTSTQTSAYYAWYQFSSGNQGWDGKDDEGAVLPVRRLSVIE